ncbi:MAG: SRPBCC family protein [Lacisediminihabitans sp.]
MIQLASAHAVSSAPASKFFARWIDHATWGEWSPDTEWVRLNGGVVHGATGILKPAGGPRTRFFISRLDADRAYDDTSLLWGARLVFSHDAAPTDEGTALDVRVTISGPLSRLWARILGKGFATSAQEDLDRLVRLVEDAEVLRA